MILPKPGSCPRNSTAKPSRRHGCSRRRQRLALSGRIICNLIVLPSGEDTMSRSRIADLASAPRLRCRHVHEAGDHLICHASGDALRPTSVHGSGRRCFDARSKLSMALMRGSSRLSDSRSYRTTPPLVTLSKTNFWRRGMSNESSSVRTDVFRHNLG